MNRSVPIGLLLLAACATPPQPAPSPASGTGPLADARAAGGWAAPPAAETRALHDRYRVAGLERRRFTHEEWWSVATPLIDGSPALSRERIAESVEGRPIHLVRYGTGPVPVLLWSQMHGDESTATMTLADLLHFFGTAGDDPLASRIGERLSVWMIPMLNPDGAERFQRRNAQGIDVNRDARMLATPEGRALREAQQRLRPEFGFNLHDQNVRIPVEGTDRIAAIALLAPPFDETRGDDRVRLRAARVAAVMRHAAEPHVAGHISRYDDTYNPRAFGDGMQRWGTSTVLLEAGAWRDDPEKQHLRMVNFAMLLGALDAIATGAYAAVDPAGYRGLPFNGRAVYDVLVRGGTVVNPGMPPFPADLAVNFAEPLHRVGGRIADVGDLGETSARDTLDVSGLFLHLETPRGGSARGATVSIGMPAVWIARRGPDPASEAVLIMEGGPARRAASVD
jgi:hypothetical protein